MASRYSRLLLMGCIVVGLFAIVGLPRVTAETSQTFRVDAVSGVQTGVAVHTGDTISIQATGNWCSGGIKAGGLPSCGGPEGIRPAGPGESLTQPGTPVGALIGKVGSWTFLIGRGTTTASQSDGQLYLLMNDVPGGYGDNSGSVSATVSVSSATSVCRPGAITCGLVSPPTNTGGYNATLSVDRGEGAPYFIDDAVTVCFTVNANGQTLTSLSGVFVVVTDSGPAGTRQVFAGSVSLSQQRCVRTTVQGPTGTDTVQLWVTDAGGNILPGQTPPTVHYVIALRPPPPTTNGNTAPPSGGTGTTPPFVCIGGSSCNVAPVTSGSAPGIPNLQITVLSSSSVRLDWTPGTGTVTTYSLCVTSTGDCHRLSGTTTTYSANNYAPGSYVCGIINASNQFGISAWSSHACATTWTVESGSDTASCNYVSIDQNANQTNYLLDALVDPPTGCTVTMNITSLTQLWAEYTETFISPDINLQSASFGTPDSDGQARLMPPGATWAYSATFHYKGSYQPNLDTTTDNARLMDLTQVVLGLVPVPQVGKILTSTADIRALLNAVGSMNHFRKAARLLGKGDPSDAGDELVTSFQQNEQSALLDALTQILENHAVDAAGAVAKNLVYDMTASVIRGSVAGAIISSIPNSLGIAYGELFNSGQGFIVFYAE